MAVRREEVRVTGDVQNFVTNFARARREARGFAADLDSADSKLSNVVQTAMAVTPALIPIGAAGTPIIAGLATQLGFAAAGAGAMIIAFQGMGDTLTALNEYQLNPTAENLAKVEAAMDRLSPAAQEFALYIQGIRPELDRLQDATQEGFFPGAQEGIDRLMSRLPELERFLSTVATTAGDIAAESGASLASDRWDDFFEYLQNNARPIMLDTADTVGSLTHGLAELFEALGPQSRGFSQDFREMAADFDSWATGLDQTEGFEEFLEYVDKVGPRAWDALTSIANATLQVAEAAAPVGAVALPVIEVLADTLAVVADSDAGPVLIGAAAGLSAISRAVALYNAANGTAMGTLFSRVTSRAGTASKGLRADTAAFLDFGSGLDSWGKKAEPAIRTSDRLARSAKTLGAGAAGLGLFAVAMTDLDDKMGLSNTTMGALLGLMAGPWGAAAGAFAGATLDAAQANNDFYTSLKQFEEADFLAQGEYVRAMREEYEAFRDQVINEDDGIFSAIGKNLTPGGFKNSIEDLFGASDTEEQREALEAVEEQYYRTAAGVAFLGDAMSNFEGPTTALDDTERLTEILSRAQPAMDALGITMDDLANADGAQMQGYADAISSWLREADSVPGRTRAIGSAIEALDDDLLSTSDSATELATALEALLGPALGAEEATDQWRASLAELRKELKAAAGFEGFGKGALANRELTRGYAEDVTAMLTARAEAGATSRQLAGLLESSRQQFIEEGVAAGFSAAEMRRRANAIGLTPKLVKTVFEAAGIDAVERRARALVDQIEKLPRRVQVELRNSGYELTRGQIDDLKRRYDLTPKQVQTLLRAVDNASAVITEVERRADVLERNDPHVSIYATANTSAAEAAINYAARNRTATIYVRQSRGGMGGVQEFTSADGNLFDFRRHPRIGDQLPQLRPYTGPRGLTWSEEGSGPWEAFISGHPHKRARSRSIADEVINRLGGQALWFADGGMVQRAAGRGSTYRSSSGHAGLAPQITVGGPQVRVFIDGEEVRAVVDARVGDYRAHDAWNQPSYQGSDVDD